jgi:regulator of sirC expression with transglutaminase-like and TPR domain
VSRQKRVEVRRNLARLLISRESFDAIEAALWIAAEEYPELDVEREAARVRIVAAEGARRADGIVNPFARLDAVRALVFEELGFHGNEQEYNDPRNSFLNEVLDRRLGNPLSLSMLWIEVARAAGFDARGVGLPGHFVSQATFGGRTMIVDAFHGGSVISEDDCRQLVARTTGRPSLFRRDMLRGTDERAMIARMLLNLKHIYVKAEDYERALSIVERLLLLNPQDAGELRDRGFLNAHLGRPGAALTDLECYLERTPHARDAESVRGRVAWLRRQLSDCN